MSPRLRPLTGAPPVRVVAALAALCALSAGSVGCTSSGAADRTTSTNTVRPITSTSTTTTPVVAGPTLVSAGAAPRRALRFGLEEGATSTVAVTTDLAIVQKAPAGDQTVDPPPVTQKIEYRVAKVDADGATISFEVLDASITSAGTDLTPTEVVELTGALKPLIGIRGTGHLSRQGRLTGASFTLPRGLDPDVRRQVAELPAQLGALTPGLPDEPVGVGGSWTTTDTTAPAGVEATQTTTYVVTAIEGDVVSYRATTRVKADRQVLPAGAFSKLPGVTATLVSSDLTGLGRGRLRLDRAVSAGEATVSGLQVVEVKAAKVAPQRLDQEVRVATRCREIT